MSNYGGYWESHEARKEAMKYKKFSNQIKPVVTAGTLELQPRGIQSDIPNVVRLVMRDGSTLMLQFDKKGTLKETFAFA